MYDMMNGIIIRKSGEQKYMFSSLSDIIISGASKVIDFEQFARSHSLKNVRIEEGVKAIYQYAFADCKMLENITIPDSVAFIDMGVFMQCTSLKSLHLGNGVIALADHICTHCPNLKTIYIPPSTIQIDYDALKYSSIECIRGYTGSCAHEYALEHKIYFESVGVLSNSGSCGDNINWTYNSEKKELNINGYGKMYDYGWRNRAPWRNFKINSVIIGDKIESIGRCAFLNCIYLDSIKIGKNTTFIHKKAFQFSGTPKTIEIHPENKDIILINKNTISNKGIEIVFSDFNCFAIE